VIVSPSLETLDYLEVDSIVISTTTDLSPIRGLMSLIDWRMCGGVATLVKNGLMTGCVDESVLLSTQGRLRANRIFFFGWGDDKIVQQSMHSRMHWMISCLHKAKAESYAMMVPDNCPAAYKAATSILKKVGSGAYLFENISVKERIE